MNYFIKTFLTYTKEVVDRILNTPLGLAFLAPVNLLTFTSHIFEGVIDLFCSVTFAHVANFNFHIQNDQEKCTTKEKQKDTQHKT